jgi:hypothetical protein
MGRVIKLTEQDLEKLVRKVIKEDGEDMEGEEGMEQLRWEKLAKLAYDDGDEEISLEQEETVKEIKEELDEFLYGESTVEMMKNQVNILLNYL